MCYSNTFLPYIVAAKIFLIANLYHDNFDKNTILIFFHLGTGIPSACVYKGALKYHNGHPNAVLTSIFEINCQKNNFLSYEHGRHVFLAYPITQHQSHQSFDLLPRIKYSFTVIKFSRHFQTFSIFRNYTMTNKKVWRNNDYKGIHLVTILIWK